jgi:geranylgeranyl pyrophosphate synthase
MTLARNQAQPLHWIPDGAELHVASALVQDDLVPTDGLIELVGPDHFVTDDPLLGAPELPRIRPVLVALTARAAGATEVDGETQYVAELLHLALLVHDLALGREGGLRRRVARRLLRRSVGFLTGNHLTLRALELARSRRPELSDAILDTLREFADGQASLRVLQEGVVPDRQDWAHHADTHTGALFGFCCRAGGFVANADLSERLALGRYGRALGRLWQVAEDVSALRHGDAGRHLLSRALEGRPVLPVICAAELEPDIGQDWADLVRTPSLPHAERLAGRVLATGGLTLAAQVMVRDAWAARLALKKLPPSPFRDALDALPDRLARAGIRGHAPSP